MIKGELAKNLMCVQMRSGVELWYESDRIKKIQDILENLAGHKFVNIDDRTLNTADIVGIFSATDMEEVTRRKNGQWKDEKGWHNRNEVVPDMEATHRDLYRFR